ncbi:arp2/3 complex 16 kDa subunit [Tremella mesenterica]|uniref:Actin-related protein 2/3 complex subunit 5 n=1 Tax=Tremella mesenterica TaxID=5217 RepID=A0A4Q1BD05_TREME|nr:arp2/3 complex 16 kDa subunit [Tremella mesenterica]
MAEYAFRKIDIDALDEDVILPSDLYDPDPRGAQGVLDDAKRKSTEARGLVSRPIQFCGWTNADSLAVDLCWYILKADWKLINRGDIAGALNQILTDPPYGEGMEEARNLTTQALLLILNSTRATDIPGILKNLKQDQQDRLMAYLYKGMAALGQGADISGSVLLTWHEKLTEVAGVGCIVRVMTDRRTL